MADIDSDIKQRKLGNTVQNQETPSKFYHHFLYKAVIVLVFLVILPLIPSQAPEFINQTVVTRSWELLHLLFVGIAVLYGLFCHRNDETEKENNNNSKFDNAQSYVSRLLQLSSVFEDEAESPTESNENKLQTWSHQYHRNEPVVVMAQRHSVVEERRANSSRIEERPLLLPIRSLKSRVSSNGVAEISSESNEYSASVSRPNSKSGSKRFSINSSVAENGDAESRDSSNMVEKIKDNVVLPSPIPWRSRSGRMNVKDEVEVSPRHSLASSLKESEFVKLESRPSRSQTSGSSLRKSSPPSPSQSSPRNLSPLSSLPSETQAKNADDLTRKKRFYKCVSAPIPPPPPPPPMMHRVISMKPTSLSNKQEVAYEKEMRRSLTSEMKNSKWSNGDNLLNGADAVIEAKARNHVEGLFKGKSVRTIKTGTTLTDSGKEVGENETSVKRDSNSQRIDMGKSARMGTYEQNPSEATGDPSQIDRPFMETQEEENEDYVDKVIMESDVDTESDDDNYDDIAGSFMPHENETNPAKTEGASDNAEADSSSASADGPDVDKKADEFIAKFREQIRLQRIDSIKRSSEQMKRNSSR